MSDPKIPCPECGRSAHAGPCRSRRAQDRDLSEQHLWNRGKAPVGARGLTSRELHPWERRRGARFLAAHAADADELRQLLDLVGLTAADGLTAAISPFATGRQ